MKLGIQIAAIITVILFALPFLNGSVHAIPSLPSSFYGTVKLNNTNVPDGTVVQAFTGDQMIAQGYTQTYQGDSVYTLDVPGDDTDTAVIDGGREGDMITFKVGNLLANQTGIWHSATNIQMNLSVTSASTSSTPEAVPTHLPSQTAIVVAQKVSKTSTPTLLASTTAIIPSLVTNDPDILTSTPELPDLILPITGNQLAGDSKNLGKTILIIAMVVILGIGAGFIVWIRRKKKY